jgi:hypothetical protein
MRHRVGQGVLGLVAGLATICLLSLPASANTATLQFVNVTGTTPGRIAFFTSDGEPSDPWLPDVLLPTGSTCSSGTANNFTLTLSGGPSSGGLAGSITTCRAYVLGSSQFCEYLTVALTGTWSTAGMYRTYNATATMSMIVKRNTGTTHNCHSVATTFCTISVDDIFLSGIITGQGTGPTLGTSDTLTMSGTSPDGSVTVSGSASVCGLWILINTGYVEVNSKAHVVSVP